MKVRFSSYETGLCFRVRPSRIVYLPREICKPAGMAIARAKATYSLCPSILREPILSVSFNTGKFKLRQITPCHTTETTIVRLYATSAPASYRKCRDIASILDSPQNKDPSPRPVEIIGHVRTIRAQKRRAFAALADGSTARPLQVLLSPDQASGYVRSNIDWGVRSCHIEHFECGRPELTYRTA